jgi:hypothetical protein
MELNIPPDRLAFTQDNNGIAEIGTAIIVLPSRINYPHRPADNGG